MNTPLKPTPAPFPILIAFFKGTAREYLNLGIVTLPLLSGAAAMRNSYRPIYENL